MRDNGAVRGRRAADDDLLTRALDDEWGFQGWGVQEALEEFRRGRTATWDGYGNAHSLVMTPTEVTIALEPFGDGPVLGSLTLTHDEFVEALSAWARRKMI
jgi:hypothetical protein